MGMEVTNPPPHYIMSTITTNSRVEYIRAMINECLRADYMSCASCGELITNDRLDIPCCEQPVWGTNKEHFRRFISEKKELTRTRMNSYGSNKDKTIRWGVSIPTFIYEFIRGALKPYGEKVVDDKYDVQWWMKHFPMFCVPEKI